MTIQTATATSEPLYALGEGIIWDDRAELVRWVDIHGERVHSGRLEDGRVVEVASLEFDSQVGAVALAADGGLLVVVERGLAVVSPGGEVSWGPDLLGDRQNVRFNDGIVDPQGRLLVGTLALSGPGGDEALLRISPSGEVEVILTGIGLSNGLGFSPDGTTIYFIDTSGGAVSRHSYCPGAFDHAEPWSVVANGFPGLPDGMTVDASGDLWVALWEGSSVVRVSPEGVLLETIAVGAAQVTCPAFIGRDLNVLAVTTARAGAAESDVHAGAIFVAGVSATGLPEFRWGGSTSDPYWKSA